MQIWQAAPAECTDWFHSRRKMDRVGVNARTCALTKAPIGLRLLRPHAEEGVVKSLSPGREPVTLAHFFAAPFDFARFVGPLLTPLALPARGPGGVLFGTILARFLAGAMALP